MASSSRLSSLFWLTSLVMCFISSLALTSASRDADVARMFKSFRESSKGYITVGNEEFASLVDGDSRSYAVFVFGDSSQHQNSPKLELGKRLKSIGDAAKSTLKHQRSSESGILDNFIVVRIMLENSKATFGRIGVVGLPYFSCIPQHLEIKPGKGIELPGRYSLTPGPVEDWRTEEIANFMSAAAGIDVGDVSQMQSRSPFLPLIVLFVLGNIAVLGYKLANSSLIHFMPMYICGSLVVYWFSVSGGMFNIIRGMPFIGVDRRSGSPIMFMPGNGQVGVEGFIMGTSVVAFGMLMAHFVLLVPKMEDPVQRRRACYGILLMAWILFKWITDTHIWKVGLRSRFYF